MEKKFVAFRYKAPYFLLGSPGPGINKIWFVCHGYGQLAKYFIRKFDVLNDGSHLVIAPEGLSRFYLDNSLRRSGASWMTSEERETDIENYINYLEELGRTVIKQLEDQPLHITFLGFSQGAATASRWMAHTSLHVDRFILWAGIFPSDLNQENARRKLKNSENFLIVGSKDSYINESRKEEHAKMCADLDIYPQLKQFEGAHEISQEVLKEFL